ncbi:MAG: cadherin domain-containing protein [Caldilineaceae bacterium]|nr:cadherin domain-containing protein [Caldilineaceae bacterium]
MNHPQSSIGNRRTISLTVGLCLLAAAILALALAPTAWATVPAAITANGDLDPAFDTDGRVSTDLGGGERANGIAQQPDGRIVAAGTSNNDFAVTRYLPDGSLDTSFSGDGQVITDLGGSERGNAVAIQPDGKIVVAGTSNQDFALARYNPDGSLDTSFAGDGLVTVSTDPLGGNFRAAEGTSVAIQTDGKILVGGSIKQGEPRKFALVRLLSDGILDQSFDSDGFATSQFDPGGLADEEIKDISVRADGEIAAVGEYKSGQFALARYNPDGSLNASFGSGGRVTVSNKVSTGYGVGWQADGSIVAAGSKSVTAQNSANCIDSSGKKCEYDDFWLARFNGNGSLDPNFGTGGEVTAAINSRGNDDNGRGLLVQADDKIIVFGYSDMAVHTFSNGGDQQNVSIANDFSLVRFSGAGLLDASFGISGTVTTPFFRTCGINQCDTGDEAHAGLIQADGKIVLAGVTGTESNSTTNFALARYANDVAGAPILLPDTIPQPDNATTPEETAVTVDVLANDSSGAGFPLTLLSVSNSSGGTAVIENNKVRFTPAKDFEGPAYVFYAVSNATPGIDRVSTSLLVNVTPVNDPPTAISLSRANVAENAPEGTPVGRFQATDVDKDDLHTFFILSGQDGAAFQLNGDQLLTQMPFDYETKSSYTVRVKVTDSGNASYEQDVTVTVDDVNDAPTAVNISNDRVGENLPAGTVVGTLSSVDPDSGDTHTYALVPGSGGNGNGAFTLNGATLSTAVSFDYERQTGYSIRARSTDQKGAFTEQRLVIGVNDQASPPDPPPNLLSLCSGDAIPLMDNSASAPARKVLAQINNVVITNLTSTTCTVTGSLTITSNGSTVSNLTFQGNVDGSNQFVTSSIQDFSLSIGGIVFALRQVSVAYEYGQPQLRIRQPAVTMPADWGGLSAPFGRAATLDGGGFESAGASFKLPKIVTKGGYGLDLSGSLKPAGDGYEIAADGILSIPNVGKNKATGAKGQTCAINAGVTIYAGNAGETVMEIATYDPANGQVAHLVHEETGSPVLDPRYGDDLSVVRLSEVRVGFKCSQGIPIGNTGLFLTSVKGTISLRPDNEFVRVDVTVEAAKRIPAINKPALSMEGTMQVDISPQFQVDLSGALYVLSFKIAEAQAVVNERSFRAEVSISAVFIHGNAWIHAWSADDSFHFTGGGNISVGLKKGSIDNSLCIPYPCGIKTCSWGLFDGPCGVKFCEACVPIPPFSLTLASGGAQFGEFTNGRYGFKGWIDVPVAGSVGFYVDEEGDIDFGNNNQYQLVTGPSVRAAYTHWRNDELQKRGQPAEFIQPWDASIYGVVNRGAILPDAHSFVTDRSGRLLGVTINTRLDKSALVERYDGLNADAAVFLRAGDVISPVNLLDQADVAFSLVSDKPLTFNLITPDGDTVTTANYASHPKYAITHQQIDRYEPANPQEIISGTARLRFVHASAQTSLAAVDVKVDGSLLFASARFTGSLPLDYVPLAPGAHTVEVLAAGGSQVLFTQQMSLTAELDYTLLLAGSATGGASAALSLLTDDNAPPTGYDQSRVRFVNGANRPLDLYVGGAKIFSQIPFRGASAYATIGAGEKNVEFRNSSGQVVGEGGVASFAPGAIYTFFATDVQLGGQPTVGGLQRLDREYIRNVRNEYGVDQAEMGLWKVEITGDLDNIYYAISVSGPTSPPVLGGVMVDATDISNAQVGWMLTSDYLTNDCNIYLNPGPIVQTVTVTNSLGMRTTETVPVYEGFPVMELVIDDPNDLGRPLNMGIDISNVPSGDYHMWMRVEDGVNPPVPAYAIDANSARARAITGPDDLRFGVNAARFAKAGYSPLAQLQDAVTIKVDHSASWPGNWNATIRTELDETDGSLYVEWEGLDHLDADNYEVLVSAAPIGTSQVISAGGLIAPRDADGKIVGTPLGFITLPNVDPEQTYSISIRAVNGFNGSTVTSQQVNVQAAAGDYQLTTPAASYTVAQGSSAQVTVTLQELATLFFPDVSLGVDLTGAPRGLDVGFTGSGTSILSTAGPTAYLQVNASNSLAAGNYSFKVIGYNGTRQREVTVQIVVVEGAPELQNLYLPAVVR